MKTLRIEFADLRIFSGLLALGLLTAGAIEAYQAAGRITGWALALAEIIFAVYIARGLRSRKFQGLRFTEEDGLQFTTSELAPTWCKAIDVEEFGCEFSIAGDGSYVIMQKKRLNPEFLEILTTKAKPNQSSHPTLAQGQRV